MHYLRGEIFKEDLRNIFFTQREIDMYKKLPEEVIEGGTMMAFKNDADRYIAGSRNMGLGPSAGKLN